MLAQDTAGGRIESRHPPIMTGAHECSQFDRIYSYDHHRLHSVESAVLNHACRSPAVQPKVIVQRFALSSRLTRR